MNFRNTASLTALLAALAFAPVAMGAGNHAGGHGEHAGHDMAGHDALEAKLADTSAFGEKGDPAKATRTVKITGEEMEFSPGNLTFKAGETVTFEFKNTGEKAHELTIGDAAYQQAAHDMMVMMANMGMKATSPEHEAAHAAAGNTAIAKPGETKTITWRFTKPGQFLIACNFIGHAEAGMTGTITVQ